MPEGSDRNSSSVDGHNATMFQEVKAVETSSGSPVLIVLS